MKTVKATLYKTDGSKEPIVLNSDTSLDTLQKLVGGLIEVVYILSHQDELNENFENGNDLIINEEGRLLDLPANPFSKLVGLNSMWEAETFFGDIILVEGKLS